MSRVFDRARIDGLFTQGRHGFAQALKALKWSLIIDSNEVICLSNCLFMTNVTECGPCIFITTGSRSFEFQLPPVPAVQRCWRDIFRWCGAHFRPFQKVYKIVRTIGSGSFAHVYLGMNREATTETVVIKAIDKDRLEQANAFTEIQVLRRVSHPCIASYHSAFESGERSSSSQIIVSETTLCIVMEHMKGGDLHELIRRTGRWFVRSIFQLF